MSYITVTWDDNGFFKKEEEIDKLWIGDPILNFKAEIRDILLKEINTNRYIVSRESLEKFRRIIKKILDEKFNCLTIVKIPLLETDDPKEWEEANRTRTCGQIFVTAEKEFDDMGVVRVCFGE